jgi:hypothetical protein
VRTPVTRDAELRFPSAGRSPAALAIIPERQIVMVMFVNDEGHDVAADLRALLAAIGN